MRRTIFVFVRLYLLAAVATRVLEASGLWRRCGCSDECWCKKPGLSLFRWVVPIQHRSLDAESKRALAEIRTAASRKPVSA